MQRDPFRYIWDNKYQIEVVQLSVGFVKSLLEPKIKSRSIATIAGFSLVLHMKYATGYHAQSISLPKLVTTSLITTFTTNAWHFEKLNHQQQ